MNRIEINEFMGRTASRPFPVAVGLTLLLVAVFLKI